MAQFYYYLYLIKFSDGRYYIGSRKCKCKPEEDTQYMGSPVTFKELWADSNLSKTKYILREVDSDEELRRIEPKLIKEAWKRDGKDKCLNRHASPHFHPDICSKAGKIGGKVGGKKTYELGIGVHGLTKEQRSENGKIGGKITGKKIYELGIGVHGLTKEQRSENGKIGGKVGGKKTYELGLGIHGRTKEQRSEHSAMCGKINAERNAREFSIVSPTGEVIHGRNLMRFARENNVNASNLRKVMNGKYKYHKGYTRYNDN
jgi:hypothetical protein